MKRQLALPLSAALLLASGACSTTNQSVASTPQRDVVTCAAPLKPALEHQVYFGRDRGARGEVSEAQWQRFVAEVITPRFPDGLSVLNVAGQSRAGSSNKTLRERTKLLVVVVPPPASGQRDSRIDDIAAAYRTRFEQRAVFRVDRAVCASL